ncbi:hypothetical protein ACXWTF_05865 [Thiomicrolovo sp. ZZH C-3]
MTTSEIKETFGIAASTLSDWGRDPDKKSLAMLLRAIDGETAMKFIREQSNVPKYSPVTRKIKLDKKLFGRDLLWSVQDGDPVEIDKIITLYLDQPDEDDTKAMLRLFGAERLKKTARKRIRPSGDAAYEEAMEQIAYAEDPENFYMNRPFPTIDNFLAHPKKREAKWLVAHYGKEAVLQAAERQTSGFAELFRIKKMVAAA